MNQRGLALLSTLWLVTALGLLAATAATASRAAAARAAGRIERTRGYWAAEACLAAASARWAETGSLVRLPVIALAGGTVCSTSLTDPSDGLHREYRVPELNANAAPDSLLLQLPGMTPEALMVIHEARQSGQPLVSLPDLSERLSPASRALMLQHLPELRAALVFGATSWILIAEGGPVNGDTRFRIELHVAPTAGRLAVLNRWIT